MSVGQGGRYLHFSFLKDITMISGYNCNSRSILYQCLQLPDSEKLVQQSPSECRSLDAAHISMSSKQRVLSCYQVKDNSGRSPDCIRIQGYKLLQSTINGVTQFCECLGSVCLDADRGNSGPGPNVYNKLFKREAN